MAKFLLDTHVLLWWLSDAERLSDEVYGIISDVDHKIYVSAASVWEIAIKQAIGKLRIDADIVEAIERNGFMSLSISHDCAAATKVLEPIHRDPFDRMLIAQAIREKMTLISADTTIARYRNVSLLIFRPAR